MLITRTVDQPYVRFMVRFTYQVSSVAINQGIRSQGQPRPRIKGGIVAIATAHKREREIGVSGCCCLLCVRATEEGPPPTIEAKCI